MTLNYVTLVLDAYDAQGNVVTKGSASFVPSVQLTDPGVEWIPPAPIPAVFHAGGLPSVKLLATDNTAPLPNGWTWAVTFSGVPGDPAGFSFYLPYTGGATQYLSDLAEVPAVTPMAQYLPLPTGTAAEGQVPIATGSGESSAWGDATGLPLTTLGDLLYENATPAAARLAGNTSATRKFLRQTGTGSASAAPAWDTLQAGDIPDLSGDYDAAGAAATAQSNAESFATSAVGTETARAEAAEALKAPLASPALTGTPTAPTKTALTNNTDIATTAYADAAVGVETSRAETAEALALPLAGGTMSGTIAMGSHSITNVAVLSMTGNTGATHATRYAGATTSGAPVSGTFNTGDFIVDQSGTFWVCTTGGTPGTWASVAQLASPAFTGTPTAPTKTALTSNTDIATTAYADAAVAVEVSRAEAAEALLAPKASPTFTGTPAAPTASALTDSTQIATTAYADLAVAAETSRAEAAEALLLPIPLWAGLTNGEATLPRMGQGDSGSFGDTPAGGVLHLTLFRAVTSGTYQHIAFQTGGTAASGITLSKVGLYSVVGSTYTLLSGSLTSAFSGTFSNQSKALGAAQTLTIGALYAVAQLQVGTTPASTIGSWFNGMVLAGNPDFAFTLSGQSDLPSPITSGLSTSQFPMYYEVGA